MPEDDKDELLPGFHEFRDDESSRFYRSHLPVFGTPQKTASEIHRRLSRVVVTVVAAAAQSPLRIESEDLLRWHMGIFRTTFPQEAGRLRSTQTQFGVRWREDGKLCQRAAVGTDPDRIRPELGAAFAAYNAERERCPPERRSARETAIAAASLYAQILRTHPFDDGNLRAAYPALQGALVSLGGRAVDFQAALTEHDEALGWALRPDLATPPDPAMPPDSETRSVIPFAELLIARMQASGSPASDK
jgi:fido (protein-threonine AMPylation protein)